MSEATTPPKTAIAYEAKPSARGVQIERGTSQIQVIVPMLGSYAPMPAGSTDGVRHTWIGPLAIIGTLFLSWLGRQLTRLPNPPLAVFTFTPATFAVTLTSRTGRVRTIACPREQLQALHVQREPAGVALRIAGMPPQLLLPNTQSSLLTSLHAALQDIAPEVRAWTPGQPT